MNSFSSLLYESIADPRRTACSIRCGYLALDVERPRACPTKFQFNELDLKHALQSADAQAMQSSKTPARIAMHDAQTFASSFHPYPDRRLYPRKVERAVPTPLISVRSTY